MILIQANTYITIALLFLVVLTPHIYFLVIEQLKYECFNYDFSFKTIGDNSEIKYHKDKIFLWSSKNSIFVDYIVKNVSSIKEFHSFFILKGNFEIKKKCLDTGRIIIKNKQKVIIFKGISNISELKNEFRNCQNY